MSKEPKPIPKVLKELTDDSDIIDFLYVYYEFSEYVRDRLCDYNAPETSDIRIAITNLCGGIEDFLKEKLWKNFIMERRKKHD